MTYELRRLRVPWDRDLLASDLEPHGYPELAREVRQPGVVQVQLGLRVVGVTGIDLGIAAVRCARTRDLPLVPLSIAIVDSPWRLDAS